MAALGSLSSITSPDASARVEAGTLSLKAVSLTSVAGVLLEERDATLLFLWL